MADQKECFYIVNGTLTNNGTISMTARGAKAEGQNVYLLKNLDGTYEFVPNVGGVGAARVSGAVNGRAGGNGRDISKRALGGGGSGGGDLARSVSGAGGNATSYSGGAGGGAAAGYGETFPAGQAGSSLGGAGGVPGNHPSFPGSAGSGAGNPSGVATRRAQNGTGGLLVILTNSDSYIGNLTSIGSTAQYDAYVCGGASGGGSINVFFLGKPKDNFKNEINANGAVASKGTHRYGGAGGNGTVTIGSIVSNYYTDLNI